MFASIQKILQIELFRDVLIIGCNSNSARDKIIQQGEAVSLNQVIEILQTEESTHSMMQQIQDFQKKPIQQINYTAEARNPRNLLTSRIPVLLVLQVPRENAFNVENPTAENT